ncbi:MAG TPA: MFS transporter [Actinomycetota bacterium]|jgi:MFS family permease|nr:MFS transporter [Actinomycetota bacterium]
MVTRERIAYPVLMVLGALDAAGYSVIAPVTPAIASATGAGPALIGALVASFPVGIMVGFVLGARGVKRGHSTAVLLLSLGLVALGSLGFVLGHTLEVYFAARLVMGLGSGGVWIGVTFGTLERWPGCEYLCMSRIFSAYAVGAMVGPALGAIGGIRAPFLAYLALLCASAILVVVMGRPTTNRAFRSDFRMLRLPGFWLASSAVLLVVLALGTMDGVLPLHLAERLSQGEIGALYAGASLLVAASAAVAARSRPGPLVLASVALVVSGIAMAGLVDVVPLWIVAFGLAGLGAGAGYTGSAGVLFETVGTERIVTAMVVWSQIGILGYVLGPLAGGAVAQGLGFGAIGLVPAAASALVLVTYARTRSVA